MNRPETLSAAPRSYSVADIRHLMERGYLAHDSKFELLGGKLIDMSPKGPLHEEVRQIVSRWLRKLPAALDALPETTLYLDEDSFVEPDWVVFDAQISAPNLKPADVLLAIEVGDSSWKFDTHEKADRYALHGIQEYWAIHASTRITRIHRGANAAGWTHVREIQAGAPLAALCAPDALLTL